MRIGALGGTSLALTARMRLLTLLVVLLTTACTSGFPGRIRPGSDVVLPDGQSLAGGLVGAVVCEKARRDKGQQPSATACSMVRPDTLSPVKDTVGKTPAGRP